MVVILALARIFATNSIHGIEDIQFLNNSGSKTVCALAVHDTAGAKLGNRGKVTLWKRTLASAVLYALSVERQFRCPGNCGVSAMVLTVVVIL